MLEFTALPEDKVALELAALVDDAAALEGNSPDPP